MSEQTITLRRIQDSDCLALYRWQQDPATRAHDANPAAPTWDEHLRWFTGRWARESGRWFVAQLGEGQPVGSVWVDPGSEDGVVWISVVIAPELRGRGLGKALIRLATMTLHKQGELIVWARIHALHGASLAAFTAAGYRQDRSEGVWRLLYVTSPATAGGAGRPGGPMRRPVG